MDRPSADAATLSLSRTGAVQITCRQDGRCHAMGQVDHVTCDDVERGGMSVRRMVTLEVARGGQGWRITEVHLAPAPRGAGNTES